MHKTLLVFFITIHFHTIAQTVIKMKSDGGISIIPCKVNGLPLDFIFDTGASDVSISMVEATFMLKNGFLSPNDIGAKSNFLDAAGNINVGMSLTLKEIEIEGLKLYNVKASVVQTINAPLLLGQSAISKLGTIQLNLIENTLTILNGKGAYDFSKNSQQIKHSNKKSNSPIIRNSIIFNNLEIAQYDFPKELSWINAKKACANLGKGWRLPTKDELNAIFESRNKFFGFENLGKGSGAKYWTSTEVKYGDDPILFPDESNSQKPLSNYAWASFSVDYIEGVKFYTYRYHKPEKCRFRAVKTVN